MKSGIKSIGDNAIANTNALNILLIIGTRASLDAMYRVIISRFSFRAVSTTHVCVFRIHVSDSSRSRVGESVWRSDAEASVADIA